MEKLGKFDFLDDDGNKVFVTVVNDSNYIHMGAYDINKNTLAYLDSFVGKDRVYLEVIFCNPKCRHRGIASRLLEILNTISGNSIVYGTYSPWGISDSKIETDKIAKSFYEKNGYKIVTLDNYLENADEYPSIKESDFCMSRHSNRHAIIYKKEKDKSKIKILK